MANTITELQEKLLAQGLMALREQAIMPRLVNREYEEQARQRGDTVNVPIPSAITAATVSPAATPPSTADVAPTSVAIALSQWKEAAFYLTDKEKVQARAGIIPMQASEAIKSLANSIDSYILSFYTGVYGFAGTAGTTPFGSDLAAYVNARKALFNQLAPKDNRRVVLDGDAEANALLLRAFQDASFRGDREGIMEGEIGRKMGAEWWSDQNIPTHTGGTASGATTDTAGYAVGIKTVTLASAGTGTILVGDIITFAGDTQTYAVTSGDADVSNGGTISFQPGLKVAIPGSATAITLKATHVVNLLMHRDAFAFATAPLGGDEEGVGSFSSIVDPESGLVLRLEISREHKRTRYSYDVLYGAQLVRPELAARIAG